MAQANTIDAGLGTKPVPRLALTMSVPTIVVQAANASYTIIDRLFKVVFNVGLQRYGGDDYVTSITIITSLMVVVSVLTSGFQQGIQPIPPRHWCVGARRIHRVQRWCRVRRPAHGARPADPAEWRHSSFALRAANDRLRHGTGVGIVSCR